MKFRAYTFCQNILEFKPLVMNPLLSNYKTDTDYSCLVDETLHKTYGDICHYV